MPWLDGKAIELGFFRTFAVPTIARLLLATDEFKRDADKRAEGTDIVSPESVERSSESTRGEATLRRLLAVRGKDELSKSDYLYILSIFVLEPRMWIDAYEWRPLHKHELIARCNYWIEEGKRMGIPDIPATLEEFQVFQQTYEAQHMRFHPDSRTLSLDAIDVFAHGLLPRWIVRLCLPALRTAVLALLEPRVVAALGFKQPPASARAACRGALRLRGWLVRHFLLPRADGRAET